MTQAAWAAWYHVASSDENPMHDFCNPSHCPVYLDADYKHERHSLPPAVCAAIKPAYDELCREDSLRQVLRGGTTNANESFHRIIWSMCSKKKYHIRKRIVNATNLAVIVYREDKSFDPVRRLEQRRRNRFERLRSDAELTQRDPHKYGAGIAE